MSMAFFFLGDPGTFWKWFAENIKLLHFTGRVA
jgi:hypothetical protein